MILDGISDLLIWQVLVAYDLYLSPHVARDSRLVSRNSTTDELQGVPIQSGVGLIGLPKHGFAVILAWSLRAPSSVSPLNLSPITTVHIPLLVPPTRCLWLPIIITFICSRRCCCQSPAMFVRAHNLPGYKITITPSICDLRS